MTNSPTQKQFIEYVVSKDKSEVIDHHTYYTCAVGCFLKSLGLELDLGNIIGWVNSCLIMPVFFLDREKTLATVLGGVSSSKLNKLCPTYGHLQDLIQLTETP
tara:strand:- start:75 stop:383 length:309 start_codon:yes stop_codon:yes gene_type:complete